MINFEDEIQKYRPIMEVKEAEEAIKNRDLTDMVDILKEMTRYAERSASTGEYYQ